MQLRDLGELQEKFMLVIFHLTWSIRMGYIVHDSKTINIKVMLQKLPKNPVVHILVI